LQGRRFRDGQQEAMLGELLAGSLNKKVGDTIDLQGSTFTVVGIFRSGSALETGAIILPLDEMQNLSSMTGKVTAYHVKLKPAPAGVTQAQWQKEAEDAVEKDLPGLRAVPAAQRAANNQLVLLAHAAAWGTSLIALLVAALGIANTMAMSVFERTKEIGVLRAMGWSRGRVMTLILIEAAALGAGGRRGRSAAGVGSAAGARRSAADGEHCVDDVAGRDAARGATDGDPGGRAGGVGAGVARSAVESSRGAAA
jgi:putative ABC transport system permease protein